MGFIYVVRKAAPRGLERDLWACVHTTYITHLVKPHGKIHHLLFNHPVFTAFLLQFLFHLIERLHHFFLLLRFGVALPLLLLQFLLKFIMLYDSSQKNIKTISNAPQHKSFSIQHHGRAWVKTFKSSLVPIGSIFNSSSYCVPFLICSACSFHCFTSFSLTNL